MSDPLEMIVAQMIADLDAETLALFPLAAQQQLDSSEAQTIIKSPEFNEAVSRAVSDAGVNVLLRAVAMKTDGTADSQLSGWYLVLYDVSLQAHRLANASGQSAALEYRRRLENHSRHIWAVSQEDPEDGMTMIAFYALASLAQGSERGLSGVNFALGAMLTPLEIDTYFADKFKDRLSAVVAMETVLDQERFESVWVGMDIESLARSLAPALEGVQPGDVPVIAGTSYAIAGSLLQGVETRSLLDPGTQRHPLVRIGPEATILTMGTAARSSGERKVELDKLYFALAEQGPAGSSTADTLRAGRNAACEMWADAAHDIASEADVLLGVLLTFIEDFYLGTEWQYQIGSLARFFVQGVLAFWGADGETAVSASELILPPDTPAVLPVTTLIDRQSGHHHPWRQ